MEMQLAEFLNLPILIDHTSVDNVTTQTARFAISKELTVYDAAYVEIALRRALPLATLDRRLAAAARSAGIKEIGVPE